MATGPKSDTPKSSTGFPDYDFSRFFAELKLPAVLDVEAFLAASRKNIETLTAANRVALEGAQAIARRHLEILQESTSELTDAIRALSTSEPPQVKAAKQADLLKAAYERAVTNFKELSDLIQHSNAESVGLLNKRFTEALDEVKQLADKSK